METTIRAEMADFFERTGFTQIALVKESGVDPSTISSLMTGRRNNILGYRQDALRDAMRRMERMLTDADAAARECRIATDTSSLVADIKAFLERTGFTRAALAKESGVDPTTVSGLMTGRLNSIIGCRRDALRDAMRRMEQMLAPRRTKAAS